MSADEHMYICAHIYKIITIQAPNNTLSYISHIIASPKPVNSSSAWYLKPTVYFAGILLLFVAFG